MIYFHVHNHIYDLVTYSDDTSGLERDGFQSENGRNQESMDRGSDEDQANEQSVVDR